MLIIVSPAKTLDFESDHPAWSIPHLNDQSLQLVQLLQTKDVQEIATLMKLSDRLATLNHQRYQTWQDQPVKAAVHAFKGDVYRGLKANQWDQSLQHRAQQHLRILSGLYGVLQPYDEIRPYRLEMGTSLPNTRGKHLYDFWQSYPTDLIQKDLHQCSTDEPSTLLNLASQEYFKVIQAKSLQARVITPVFKDEKNGRYKVISFYAKYARGLMVDYMLRDARFTQQSITEFNVEGYQYDPQDSTELAPVFKRSEAVRTSL